MAQHDQAFTLVELLLVVTIMGILAAIMIPNLLSARATSYTAAVTMCVHSVARGQHMYFIDQAGTYAETIAELEGLVCHSITVNPVGGAAGYLSDTWTATHDSGGNPITFGVTGIQ